MVRSSGSLPRVIGVNRYCFGYFQLLTLRDQALLGRCYQIVERYTCCVTFINITVALSGFNATGKGVDLT